MDFPLQGIHIFNDDKFIDIAIEIFEAHRTKQNEYFVITDSQKKSFKYVKSSLAKPLVLKNDKAYNDIIAYINEQDHNVVYLHALNAAKRNIARKLNGNHVVVWLLWGYDFYNAWPVINQKIYLPKTKKFLLKDKDFKKNYKNSIWDSYWAYNLYLRFLKWPSGYRPFIIYPRLRKSFRSYYKAVKKIDIIVPILESELPLIKKMKIPLKSASFSYGYLEQLLGADYKTLENNNGKNILLGNSAAFSNNHLEAFEVLSKLDLGDRRVYVPLSYGGTRRYVDFVIFHGKRLLGKNFSPLLDFIPLEKYNSILKSCDTLIFNHLRQQGAGNVVSLGYLGAKIYLKESNAIYTYLKDEGAHVFSLASLTQEILDKSLTNVQIKDNKSILEKKYTFKNVLEQVKNMEEIILNRLKNKN